MQASDKYPFVTVIMPVRNEEEFIEHSLDSVVKQHYPAHRLEVIVVDGSSTDGTVRMVEKYKNKYRNIYLLHNAEKIVPKSMNAAIKRARGDYIVRVDGHCVIKRNYVKRCVEYLNKMSDVDCVGGVLVNVNINQIGKAISGAMSSPFGVGDAYFRYGKQEAYVDTLAFGAYRREVFKKIGYFDEEQVRCQDAEFNYRLRKAGGKIYLVPSIRAYYAPRSSFIKLFQQYFQYGFWRVRVLQKHPRQMQLRQYVPPLFALTFLFLLLLALFASWGFAAFLTFLGVYIAANLTASIIGAIRRKKWSYLILLPMIFSILHFSYGFGFLTGLIRFRRKWRKKREGV